MGDAMASADTPSMNARAYQLEMIEDSLRRNIVVAMDTGSGKTLIAVERIRAELLRGDGNKMVWFITPAVALTYQQSDVIRRGLETWKNQKTWDDALEGVNVIVCTYQVLADCLTHGFVKLYNIALLVVDEAHHCQKNEAPNRIMQNFYHVQKKERPDLCLPAILGLTASPVISQGIGSLRIIEANMDAIAKTPRIHREELMRYVNRPVMTTVEYEPTDVLSNSGEYARLKDFQHNIDILNDPYVIRLTEMNSKLRANTIMKRDTYTQRHFNALVQATKLVGEELGPWASRYYVAECVTRYLNSYKDSPWLEGEASDKAYMFTILSALKVSRPTMDDLGAEGAMSIKLLELVKVLVEEMRRVDCSGIVFVQTRAQVEVISTILANLSQTKDIVRSVTFVGSSNSALRKGKISELVDASNNDTAVDELRSGRKNLIISTNVAEEGIDISACNLVICFQPASNLKSFIQRRGRARAVVSKFILMLPQDELAAKRLRQWQTLEKEMEAQYQNELRQLEELKQLESEEEGYRELLVETTGAKLTLQSSLSHLYNFCSRLPSVSYTTLAPIFAYTDTGTVKVPSISCRVELPNCLDASIRTWGSKDRWASEKNARMDAAFEAYVGLRNAGLINDNLLAEPQIDSEAQRAYSEIMQLPSMVQVDGQMNCWKHVASQWEEVTDLWITEVSVVTPKRETLRFKMVTSCRLPPLAPQTLFVDHDTTAIIYFQESVMSKTNKNYLEAAKATTFRLLYSVYRTRMDSNKMDFPVLFCPTEEEDHGDWHVSTSDEYPATELLTSESTVDARIVRSRLGAFVLHGIEMRVAEGLEEGLQTIATPHLRCRPFPKRLDLLHPLTGARLLDDTFVYLSPEDCTVDCLTLKYVTFARMVPSILHHIDRQLVLEELNTSLLAPVQFATKENLLSAITASSAREGNNYQRLEFLGDAILKFVTALTLMAQHPKWHEGYLASMKDHIVSNGRLALAAQETGLIKYIATKQFTAYKWRPMYNEDLLDSADAPQRELSSKTMADVIEALIGAAYVDGGPAKALAVLKVFLPGEKWQPLKQLTAALQLNAMPAANSVGTSSPQIIRLEKLLDHTFDNKALLLEAMTHGSHVMSTVPSYQRLEYLGDAVLDHIVTGIIFDHKKQPPVYLMHRLRTATVNAGFLAYRALSTSTSVTTAQIDTLSSSDGGQSFKQTTSNPNLLDFLQKAHNPDFNVALSSTRARYNLLQPLLKDALGSDTYPWSLFAAFDPEKTVSDIVESVLGAVFIDSGGNFAAVEKVARTLGLLDWLERALDEDVRCWHPKEEIGTFGRMGGESGVMYNVWRSKNLESAEPNGAEAEDVDDTEDDVVSETHQLELGKGTWHCRIVVNGEAICVKHGWNKLEVETAAAEEAVGILKARSVPQIGVDDSPTTVEAEKAEEADKEAADGISEDGGTMLDEENTELIVADTSPGKRRRSLTDEGKRMNDDGAAAPEKPAPGSLLQRS